MTHAIATTCVKTRHQRGFTLIELVISLVVIGIATVGLLLVFTQTVSSSSDPMIRQQALAIAEAYLEEIISKHYDDPDGSEAGENRTSFDDIDDYAGISEAPRTGLDAAVGGLGSYRVDVAVSAPLAIGPGGNTATARQVTVTVSHGASQVVSLSSYRTDYSP